MNLNTDPFHRVAIVGTGGIARIHARIIGELGGHVVASCGRERASAVRFGHGEPYDDFDRMLSEQKPDVVHICTPNHLHCEQAIKAFAAGAHVLCEKPLATSGDDADRMCAAADAAAKIGGVAYCYRGYPAVPLIKSRIAAGAFGTLRRVGGQYLSQDVFAADKYQWHFTPGAVGPAFALMDYGVHWLDLVEYICGDRISEISAQFSTHQRQRIWRGQSGEGPAPAGEKLQGGHVAVDFTLEDQADLLIRLSGGGAGAAMISALSPGNPNDIVVAADGSLAGFDWRQQDPNIYVERRPEGALIRQRSPDDLPERYKWMSTTPAGHAEGYMDAFRNVIRQCWSAMQGGTNDYPSFRDGLRGVRLVEAAVESARTHRSVDTSHV
jgi:predicted dehydrogenase